MKKMKIGILTSNFACVKLLIRIVYRKNFRAFGWSLTEIQAYEKLDTLYIIQQQMKI
jgi:hypothetical protein